MHFGLVDPGNATALFSSFSALVYVVASKPDITSGASQVFEQSFKTLQPWSKWFDQPARYGRARGTNQPSPTDQQ
jgi:hypothetical protein